MFIFTDKKISILVLGNGDSLKKALITNILGKDLSAVSKKSATVNTETYGDETFEIICTPDLNTAYETLKVLLSVNQHFDMCLLAVENEFSMQEVSGQISELQKETPPETFIVVPPLSYKQQYYPFSLYSMDHLFSKLRKLVETINSTYR